MSLLPFWPTLAPDLIVFGLIVVLMLLDILRVDARWGRWASVAALVGALAVLWRPFAAGDAGYVVMGELGIDRLATAGKAVLLLCGLGLAAWFPAHRPNHRFLILAAASLLGGLVMLGSASFATLFLGVELLSLPAFALIVLGRGRGAAPEGAFKYLVLSSIASALVLFGASLAYGLTGSLGIGPFLDVASGGSLQAQAALVLVLAGLFLKAAVFPFHGWAPDAYAAAPLPVTALMASVVKAAVILAIVRVFGSLPLGAEATLLVGVLALASILYGNVAALGQLRLRRMLAYSSIAHAGYMVFALLDVTGNRAPDLLLYTLVYGLGVVLACASFAVLCPGEDDRLERLAGQFARRPLAALLLALALLSLAGVPPLPGFFAKLFVFRSVTASGHLAGALLAFVGSFIGLAYYLRPVLSLFRPEPAAAAGAEPVAVRTEREGVNA
jgi:NADH-quinone oxidoreductase subunit N